MIRVRIFDEFGVENEIQNFIQENNITREQIISINLAIDSEASRRIRSRNTKQILLAWEDNK